MKKASGKLLTNQCTVLTSILILLLLNCAMAWADLVGEEFLVNTYMKDSQSNPSIAIDSKGNFVIVWQSYGQDGDRTGVYAQRYDVSAKPQGDEFQVNTHTINSQFNPSVAMDPLGNFVITWESRWQDGTIHSIYARRYNASGTPQGSEFRVNTYNKDYQVHPDIAMDSSGNFAIVWKSWRQDSDEWGIYAQRYSAAGTSRGREFQVNTYTEDSQSGPSAAMDSSGNFIIVWTSEGQDGDLGGIYAKRYNASGTSRDSEFQVNTYIKDSQIASSVAMDSSGNFVIAWNSEGQDGDSDGIYARRYDASGTPQGSEFQVNSYTSGSQRNPTVTVDSSGNFVIVWCSYEWTGADLGIHAQHYDVLGTRQGSNFKVSTNTEDDQFPSVAMNISGNCVIAWHGYGYNCGENCIYAQRFKYPTLPAPIITSPNSGANYSTNDASSIIISGTCDSYTDTIHVNGSTSGVTHTSGESSWSYTSSTLLEGTNAFIVTSVDEAGYNSLSDIINITHDITPPDNPVIISNDGRDFIAGSPTITLSGTCSTDTIEILLNGTPFPYTLGDITWFADVDLSVQTTFVVTAIDAAGNESEAAININYDPENYEEKIWYVDKNNTSGNENGKSWETAFTEIQYGIDVAYAETILYNTSQVKANIHSIKYNFSSDNNGIKVNTNSIQAQIWVAAGRYDEQRTSYPHTDEPNINTGSVMMKENVNIYGGFNGTEGSDEFHLRDWETNETIIDGSTARDDESEYYDGIPAYHVIVGANNSTIDGFTITGGKSDGDDEQTTELGAGMFNYNVSPTISNCIFISNYTHYRGGGMCNNNSHPLITNCTFLNNAASDHSDSIGGRGGGTDNLDSSPMLYKCIFKDNNTHFQGAGMMNRDSSPTLTDCSFIDNSTGTFGSGIANRGSVLTLNNCVFSGNSSNQHGGGISNDNSSLTLNNCIFSGNSTRDDGAGIYSSSSTILLMNCTFNKNIGEWGGGVYNKNGTSVYEITNCIFWENIPDSINGRYTNVSYSCVEGGYDGEGNISADPMFIGADWGDLRPHPSSPCVSAATADGAPSTDIDGFARPQGAGIDMGAYEVDENAQLADIGLSLTADSTVDDQGKWCVKGGDWRDIGTSLEVYAGDYIIEFMNIAHYATSTAQSVTVDEGSHVDVATGYVYSIGANIWRVDGTNASGTEDGTSWATAYTSIQNGMDAALAAGGGEIWVAEGTYTGTGGNVVVMKEDVRLYGGFSGMETMRDQRDWAAHEVVIDGEGTRRCVHGANNATLDGFIITGGKAEYGGGMYNKQVSLTVTNCIFTDNTTEPGRYNGGDGGGIYNLDSSLSVLNCLFINNIAHKGSREDCSDFNLCTTIIYGGQGGGIYNSNSICDIEHCTFASNIAEFNGSAIYGSIGQLPILYSGMWMLISLYLSLLMWEQFHSVILKGALKGRVILM